MKAAALVWATALALTLALTLGVAAVRADVTTTDVQVAARALSFMESPPSGRVRVGIPFDPSDRSTVRQARQVEELLTGGLRVGNLTLEPVTMSMADAATADIDLVFLIAEMRTHGQTIRNIATEKRLPCITTDIQIVRDGACALGVRSAPRVQILVNRATASDSGTTFATAFRVMVTEL